MNIDNCSYHAICNNTEGSFNCSCRDGFSGDGISCTGNYHEMSCSPISEQVLLLNDDNFDENNKI